MSDFREQLIKEFDHRVEQSGAVRAVFHNEVDTNAAAVNRVVESTRNFVEGYLLQYLLQCGQVCELIADALGPPNDLAEIFVSGGKGHDVGKAKFSRTYQTYPLNARQLDDYRFGHLVRSIGMIEPVVRGLSGSMMLKIVGYHHERADRSGPMGHEHKQLLSQLFALTDEFITILWPPHPKDPNASKDAMDRFMHMQRTMRRNATNGKFSTSVVYALLELIERGVFDKLELDNLLGKHLPFGEVRRQIGQMDGVPDLPLSGLRREASGTLREV